jgi:S-adenosylmethionine synthetase
MLRTAESVSPRHPDKLCDQISDAILDEALQQDPYTRAGIETVGGHGKVFVTGEMTFNGQVDAERIVRRFVGPEAGVTIHIAEQSREIAGGVDTGGAGDQGIMVGYATSATPSLMPLEVWLSRDLNRRLYERWPNDGKTQITVNDGRISAVVASFQNSSSPALAAAVREWLRDKEADDDVRIHINPTGEWRQGGFDADAGLTGRKLAVDNYGPHIPVGGGAFSGKDASKVDRSAAYMARKLAVDYLRQLGAQETYVHLAYAIGVAEPVHAEVVADGRKIPVHGYDLTPRGITEFLDLRRPQYVQTAAYGHFGNGFAWDLQPQATAGRS